VGRLAFDQNGRRPESQRTEMRADKVNFAVGQSGCGHNVVDPGIGVNLSGGLGANTRHFQT
jgi:hypothetical protein